MYREAAGLRAAWRRHLLCSSAPRVSAACLQERDIRVSAGRKGSDGFVWRTLGGDTIREWKVII